MSDEIKEKIKAYYIGDDIDKVLDNITNLQEIAEEHKNCTRKHWQQKCAEHCAKEMIYKSIIDKANEVISSILYSYDERMYEYCDVKYIEELRELKKEFTQRLVDIEIILNGGDKE